MPGLAGLAVAGRGLAPYACARLLGIEITAMIIVVLVVHVMLAVTLIGVVLVQKSEGGGLGIGGGGGMSGFMTGRSTANLRCSRSAYRLRGLSPAKSI